MNKVCAIIGFGPGLGTAYASTFAQAGYSLALISRSGAGQGEDAGSDTVRSYACNAGDPAALTTVLDRIEAEQGQIDVLLYNADIKRFGPVEDISTEDFEASWRASVLGLFASAKVLGPRMAGRGGGTIVVSGATASLRGAVWTTALAPAKSAQRILSQSLAKQLGPKGVHLAYIVIDGVIDTAEAREHFAPDETDEFFIQPGRIAETALMLVGQDRSAWTFELDIRPFGEKW